MLPLNEPSSKTDPGNDLKTLRFGIAAVLLILTSAADLTSQEYQAYSFQGKLRILADEKNVFQNSIKNGDDVMGQFIWDTSMGPDSIYLGRMAFYNMEDGVSGLSMSCNGWNFNSVRTVGDQLNVKGTHVMLTNLESTNTGNPDRYNRSHGIYLRSYQNNVPLAEDPSKTFMALELFRDDDSMDGFSLYLLPDLDEELQPLSDWTARIWIESTDPAKPYVVICNITTLGKYIASPNTLTGKFYADKDNSCDESTAEFGLPSRVVLFEPGHYAAISDNTGRYDLFLPPGEYTAKIASPFPWERNCPGATITIPDSAENNQLDFGLSTTEYVQALDISLAASLPRPGFELQYTITVRNIGTLPYSGRVYFTHDPILLDFAAKPAADDYSMPHAMWYIDNMQLDEVRHFQVSVRVPPDEKLLGTVICARADSDSDYKNNDDLLRRTSDEICQEIRGAYDPNDIQVFTGTRNADGPILQDQTVLSYLIRFQNEGNEDAITVRVVDELSEFHDIAKLRIGAASHDYEFNFTENGALEWTFKDINLPPKSEDKNGSMGYLKFEVQLKDGLPVDTEIPNKAAIYFDFNSPVITNTVVSRITDAATSVDETLNDIGLQIYPNPASETVTITRQNSGRSKLELLSQLGERLLTTAFSGTSQVLDLSGLAAGSYYLRITEGAETIVAPLRIVR